MIIENSIRKRILELAMIGKEGHIGPSFSVVEILSSVIGLSSQSNELMIAPHNVVLSKGHAALALYATLIEYGYIEESKFADFASKDSPFGGHPSSSTTDLITFSTGSLGHGLPLLLGRAFNLRDTLLNEKFVIVLGDGELNEGSNWEALMLAKKFNLKNVLLIIDDNGSSKRAIDMSNLPEKISAFGYDVIHADGHSTTELKEKIQCGFNSPRLSCVIAKTQKGFGTSLTQGNPSWHHRVPNKIEYTQMMKELLSGD